MPRAWGVSRDNYISPPITFIYHPWKSTNKPEFQTTATGYEKSITKSLAVRIVVALNRNTQCNDRIFKKTPEWNSTPIARLKTPVPGNRPAIKENRCPVECGGHHRFVER
jgi:hypothetical protein